MQWPIVNVSFLIWNEIPTTTTTRTITCTACMNEYFLSNTHTSWVERSRHYWVERPRHFWVERSKHYRDDVNVKFLDDSKCNPCWIVWLFPGLHYNVIINITNTTLCTHLRLWIALLLTIKITILITPPNSAHDCGHDWKVTRLRSYESMGGWSGELVMDQRSTYH